MPSTSVIITTKDRPLFLRRALKSVLNQTVQPNEIIIVQDGSENDLSDTHELPFTNIKIINNQKSLGGASARNIGASNASHEILMFLDDDDEWKTKKIEKQLSTIKNNKKAGLVYSGREIRTDKNPSQILRRACSRRSGCLFPAILQENYVGVTSSVAIQSELFFAAGGFDENLPCRQDYDLWIRISQLTNIYWDDFYNVLYTVWTDHKNQISKKPEKHPYAASYIISKYADHIKQLPATNRRSCYAEKWFSVAKAYRSSNKRRALKYLIRSQKCEPSLRRLGILAPDYFLKKNGII